MAKYLTFKSKIFAVVIMVMLISIIIANISAGSIISRYLVSSETEKIQTQINLVSDKLKSDIANKILLAQSLTISLIKVAETTKATGFNEITIFNNGVGVNSQGSIEDEIIVSNLKNTAENLSSNIELSNLLSPDQAIIRLTIKRSEFQTEFFDIDLSDIQNNLKNASGSTSYFELTDASENKVFSNVTENGVIATTQDIPLANKTWKLTGFINQNYINDKASELKSSITLVLILSAILLTALSLVFIRLAFKPMVDLRAVIRDLSKGEADLTQRLKVKVEDDIGIISNDINQFVEKLHDLILQVSHASSSVERQVEVLNKQAKSSQELLVAHTQETEQIAAAITEMGNSADSAANSARKTASLASDTLQQTNESKEVVLSAVSSVQSLVNEVDEMSESFNVLNKDADEIGSIAQVIASIAEQTNLLALNAAIEAARAGEQGRGFAVVADEVRALAARTQRSTSEINEMLGGLRDGTSNIGHIIESTRKSCQDAAEKTSKVNIVLDGLITSISEIDSIAAVISNASTEQELASNEISKNMGGIQEVVVNLQSNGETNLESVHSLVNTHEQLVNVVQRFKLKQ